MSLNDVNKDRTLYDLCRRYKYHYNAVKKLRDVNECYYHKSIKGALNQAEKDLEDTTKRIFILLMSHIVDGSPCDIECVAPIECVPTWNHKFQPYMKRGATYTVTIEDEEFADLMRSLLALIRRVDYEV